jgi:hypothetical protein
LRIKKVGAFIRLNPIKLSKKLGKSVKMVKKFQNLAQQHAEEVIAEIKNPESIIHQAVDECKNILDSDQYSQKKTETFSVLIKPTKLTSNNQFRKVNTYEKNKKKIHAYKIEWAFFDVSWEKYVRFIKNAGAEVVKNLFKIIPVLGGPFGEQAKKKIKQLSDNKLRKEIKNQFNHVFHNVLYNSRAICYLKYKDRRINLTPHDEFS